MAALYRLGSVGPGVLPPPDERHHLRDFGPAVGIGVVALGRLAFDDMRPLPLAALETPELLAVKPGRTIAEYCWTITPFAPRFVFEADPAVRRVTYVDADLWFMKSPGEAFSELESSGKHVLITEHAYDPRYDQSRTSGRFCVQFVTFVREDGEAVRKRWELQCVDWCFARLEGNRFGDQKYLDAWPEEYPASVHVFKRRGGFLAPWNATRFAYSEGFAWHFHGFRVALSGNGRAIFLRSDYLLPTGVLDAVYSAYELDICNALVVARSAGLVVKPQVRLSLPMILKRALAPFLKWFIAFGVFRYVAIRRIDRD